MINSTKRKTYHVLQIVLIDLAVHVNWLNYVFKQKLRNTNGEFSLEESTETIVDIYKLEMAWYIGGQLHDTKVVILMLHVFSSFPQR